MNNSVMEDNGDLSTSTLLIGMAIGVMIGGMAAFLGALAAIIW